MTPLLPFWRRLALPAVPELYHGCRLSCTLSPTPPCPPRSLPLNCSPRLAAQRTCIWWMAVFQSWWVWGWAVCCRDRSVANACCLRPEWREGYFEFEDARVGDANTVFFLVEDACCHFFLGLHGSLLWWYYRNGNVVSTKAICEGGGNVEKKGVERRSVVAKDTFVLVFEKEFGNCGKLMNQMFKICLVNSVCIRQ